jgi:VCBS repeat-containing protein
MADTANATTPRTAIGEVEAVSGRAVAIARNGEERQLVAGDTVYEGETVRTLGASTIVIGLTDGTRLDLGRDADALLDGSLLANDIPALREESIAEIAELQALIAAGGDPTELADAPAAGGEPGSAADESLQAGVRIERTGRVGSVEAGFETDAPAVGFGLLVDDSIAFGGPGDGDATGAGAGLPVTANAAPVAADDAVTTAEDTPLTIAVLANDGDPDGDALTVTAASAGNGVVAINPDGTIRYTPDADFNGTDRINYRVSDGNGGTDTATVTVTVNPVADPPVAADDSAVTDEDTPVILAPLSNDSDPDGDPLTVTMIAGVAVTGGDIVTLPSGATVTLNPDGTLSYDPNGRYDALAAGDSAADGFDYQVSDGNGGFDTARATVTVNGVGAADLPTATIVIDPVTADNLLTPAEAGGTVAVTGRVTDDFQPGDEVTLTVDGASYKGNVMADGSFSIDVPGSQLAGDADHVIEASVTVSDALGNNATATAIRAYAVASDTPPPSQQLVGEYYAYNDRKVPSNWETNGDDGSVGNLNRLSEIEGIINARAGSTVIGDMVAGAPTATFASTGIDYNLLNGGSLGRGSNLQRFLGADGNSLSRDPAESTDGIVRIFGYVYVDPSQTDFDFRVRSDDGFSVRIGDNPGPTFGNATNHAPRVDTFQNVSLDPGLQEIEILYWDQGGRAVLEIQARPAGGGSYVDFDSSNFGFYPPESVVPDPDNPGGLLFVEGATLIGTAGSDNLEGTDHLDILVGGGDDDTLTGGAGVDTFVWKGADKGARGNPAEDTVSDFSLDEGDALDLADLLVDESVNPLTDYLSFDVTANGDTLVHISSDGGFAGGGYAPAAEDQTIVLEGIDLTTLGGSDAAIIDALIAGNHLVVDS